MPELKEFEVKGRSIQKGDVVVLPGSEVETSPIAVVETKSKYVWMDGEDGTKGRVGVNDTVTVKRMVPTEAELAAELRTKTNRYLEAKVANFQASYNEAKLAFAQKMDEPWGADHWDFERLAVATAEYRIWAKIAKDFEKTQAPDGNGKSLRDVVQHHVNEFTLKLMRDTRYLSVSTSEWSNIIDKTEAEAMRNFIRNLCGWRTDLTPQIDLNSRFF